MSTHRKIDLICVVVIVLATLLTIVFMNGEKLGVTVVVDEDQEYHSDSAYFTANDQTADWDTSGATVITLNCDSVSISGNGAYAYDGGVVIRNGGAYILSGELTDGSICVNAYDSSKVWLLFDGVNVTCSDDASFRIDQADKVFLTLADGSENSLASGESYTQEALDDGTDGAIFAHDDLTINGSGSLTVTAAYQHGIVANDDLVITGGKLTVTAPADGIRANDSLRVKDAEISATSGDDGIVVDEAEGYFYAESGTIAVRADDDGIHSAGSAIIAGGEFTINAGDDGIHADGAVTISGGTVTIPQCNEGIEGAAIDVTGGDLTIHPSDDGINANGAVSGIGGISAAETAQTESAEAYLRISGGSVTIINESGRDADGLDSNGNLYIDGGTVRISLNGDGSNSALDYASESGGVCEITGGTVIACGGSSMAEQFSATSTQGSALYTIASAAQAGTELTVTDGSSVLLSWDVPCSFTSAAVSCPQMVLNGTYRITAGSESAEFTLSEISQAVGEATGGMQRGFGGMGDAQTGSDEMQRGFGGKGHGQRFSDSESSDTDSGECPTPPNGESFTPPDGEQMTPPDGEGSTPPDGESFTPPNGEQMTPPTDGAQVEEETAAETQSEEGLFTSVTSETLVFSGIAVLLLIAAILFAVKFKKY